MKKKYPPKPPKKKNILIATTLQCLINRRKSFAFQLIKSFFIFPEILSDSSVDYKIMRFHLEQAVNISQSYLKLNKQRKLIQAFLIMKESYKSYKLRKKLCYFNENLLKTFKQTIEIIFRYKKIEYQRTLFDKLSLNKIQASKLIKVNDLKQIKQVKKIERSSQKKTKKNQLSQDILASIKRTKLLSNISKKDTNIYKKYLQQQKLTKLSMLIQSIQNNHLASTQPRQMQDNPIKRQSEHQLNYQKNIKQLFSTFQATPSTKKKQERYCTQNNSTVPIKQKVIHEVYIIRSASYKAKLKKMAKPDYYVKIPVKGNINIIQLVTPHKKMYRAKTATSFDYDKSSYLKTKYLDQDEDNYLKQKPFKQFFTKNKKIQQYSDDQVDFNSLKLSNTVMTNNVHQKLKKKMIQKIKKSCRFCQEQDNGVID